eukprot:UN25146
MKLFSKTPLELYIEANATKCSVSFMNIFKVSERSYD